MWLIITDPETTDPDQMAHRYCSEKDNIEVFVSMLAENTCANRIKVCKIVGEAMISRTNTIKQYQYLDNGEVLPA